ncbi:regulatory protein spx [Enterococcus sp. AZ135]|uniref:ArsC/Spx/MgsR family protein n=1 Tax=unclassified Enterococcus TaxID=2608891 RepID=UPI003F29B006
MILHVYTGNSSSNRKVLQWLADNSVPYKKSSVKKGSFTITELKRLLAHTENGLDDLLKRSINHSQFDKMTLNQALESLIAVPTALKTPILYDGKKLVLGFNEEEIRCFIPHERRVLEKII